jgi:hypothetical protein
MLTLMTAPGYGGFQGMRDRWPFIENHDRDERRGNDAE